MIRVRDLTDEQRKVLGTIKRIGRKKGATPRQMKAAIETALVEANLTNPSHGHADSEGWRQERRRYYKDPTNLEASVSRFFDETAKANRGFTGTAGQLAQRVQRSAYPGRYDERAAEAAALLGNAGSGRAPGGESARMPAPSLGGEPDKAARLQVAMALFDGRGDALDQLVALKQAEATAPVEGGREKSPSHSHKQSGGKLHAGGGWGGTEHLLKPLSQYAKQAGLPGRSGKRTPQQNAAVGGAEHSDHLTTRKNAYAEDYSGGSDAAQERFAKMVADHFGVKFRKNSYESGGTITVNGRKFKVQILQGAKIGHGDHAHVGVTAL